MANQEIPKFNIEDTDSKKDAAASFNGLGLCLPAMIVSVGDIGDLRMFSAADYNVNTGEYPELTQEDIRKFYLLKRSVMDFLIPSNVTAVDMGVEKWVNMTYGHNQQTHTSRHVYRELDPAARFEMYDKGHHLDTRNNREEGGIFASHLTTAGSAELHVATAFGTGGTEIGDEYREPSQLTHIGTLEPGDITIFVRQGGPRVAGSGGQNIKPTSHDFVSNRDGRSYIESQFGLFPDFYAEGS